MKKWKKCKIHLLGGGAMRKIVCILAVLAAAVLLLSSCDSGVDFKSAEELILPPLYYSEYEDLVEAFHNEVGDKNILCAPYSGDFRSAITLFDIDSDGEDEALIFYKENTPDSACRLHFFDNNSGKWITKNDITGYGSSVERADIVDMDLDGVCEIIVSWNASGSPTGKLMSVFRSEKNILDFKEISNDICSASCVVDMDSDKCSELLFIGQNVSAGVPQKYARLLKLSHGALVVMDEIKVDSNVSGYASVKTEKLSETAPMKIFFDAFKGEGQMITEMLYWDSEKAKLVDPWFDSETLSNSATLRMVTAESRDIDNNGSIEVPVQRSLIIEGEKPSIDYEEIFRTSWVDYVDGQMVSVAESYINAAENYMLLPDPADAFAYSVRNYPSQSCWIVSESTGKQENLFSIVKISNERWTEEAFENYIPVDTREDGVIGVYITQTGADKGITEEKVLSMIVRLR